MVVGWGEITRNKSTMRILAISFLFFLFSCIAKIYRTLEQFCPFLYKTISPWLEIRQWSHVVWKTNSHAVPNDESGTIWPRSASRVWNRFPSLPGSVFSWCHHVCLNRYLSVSVNKDKNMTTKKQVYLTSYFTVHICLKCALIYRSYRLATFPGCTTPIALWQLG